MSDIEFEYEYYDDNNNADDDSDSGSYTYPNQQQQHVITIDQISNSYHSMIEYITNNDLFPILSESKFKKFLSFIRSKTNFNNQ